MKPIEKLLFDSPEASLPHTLRLAAITFSENISPNELPAFRAAVAEKAGLKHDLFHNHLPNGKLVHRYPLIQYKLNKSKPMLLCLQEGVDAAQHFFTKPNWDLMIGDRTLTMKLEEMNLKQFKLQVWDQKMKYRIQNWIPFDEDNLKKYQSLALKDKIGMLEAILTGNILTMARGLGWHISKRIEVQILDLSNVKYLPYKGIQHLGFDVRMETNAFIPNHLGLGRKVAVGFGTLRSLKTENPHD